MGDTAGTTRPPEIQSRSTYVGIGGVTRSVVTDINLGRGSTRTLPLYGVRRAVWDAAFGYVSGFPVRDILYYIATRSLSKRVAHMTLRREGVQFAAGVPVSEAEGRSE